jgi:hypothetical protein
MPENEKRPLRESAGVHDVEEYCNCNRGERSTASAALVHPPQSPVTLTIGPRSIGYPTKSRG